jgi:hypothetical protein
MPAKAMPPLANGCLQPKRSVNRVTMLPYCAPLIGDLERRAELRSQLSHRNAGFRTWQTLTAALPIPGARAARSNVNSRPDCSA